MGAYLIRKDLVEDSRCIVMVNVGSVFGTTANQASSLHLGRLLSAFAPQILCWIIFLVTGADL
jgi:hypothetical protein